MSYQQGPNYSWLLRKINKSYHENRFSLKLVYSKVSKINQDRFDRVTPQYRSFKLALDVPGVRLMCSMLRSCNASILTHLQYLGPWQLRKHLQYSVHVLLHFFVLIIGVIWCHILGWFPFEIPTEDRQDDCEAVWISMNMRNRCNFSLYLLGLPG